MTAMRLLSLFFPLNELFLSLGCATPTDEAEDQGSTFDGIWDLVEYSAEACGDASQITWTTTGIRVGNGQSGGFFERPQGISRTGSCANSARVDLYNFWIEIDDAGGLIGTARFSVYPQGPSREVETKESYLTGACTPQACTATGSLNDVLTLTRKVGNTTSPITRIVDIQSSQTSLSCPDPNAQFVNGDSNLNVEGIVSVGNHYLAASLDGYIVSDGSQAPYSSILVTTPSAPKSDFKVGDVVRVSGAHQEFFCNTQLMATSITSMGTGLPPEPTFLDRNPSADELERHEGMFVVMHGLNAKAYDAGQREVPTDAGVGIDFGIMGPVAFAEGSAFAGQQIAMVRGILRFSRGTFRISPRHASDVETVGPVTNCGSCTYPSRCVEGQCCTPDCAQSVCGDDGCEGSCGNCGDGLACYLGNCVSCVPDCNGRVCGDDHCGGSCGTCADGGACIDGQCGSCQPSCDGLFGPRACGDNGCGGSCGECQTPEVCTYENTEYQARFYQCLRPCSSDDPPAICLGLLWRGYCVDGFYFSERCGYDYDGPYCSDGVCTDNP